MMAIDWVSNGLRDMERCKDSIPRAVEAQSAETRMEYCILKVFV